jgi:uncharacterized membrane protein YobD (UPF0266 family)
MAKQDNIFFEWEAPEFKHYDKNLIWYILFGVIAAGLIVLAVTRGDYFGAATTLILGLLILYFTHRKPSVVPVKITNRGFHIDNLFIPYRYVKQFWIVEEDHHKTLNLETNTYLNHTVIIELHEQDAEPIRDFLANFLPEHEAPQPSFSQRIAHRFKF